MTNSLHFLYSSYNSPRAIAVNVHSSKSSDDWILSIAQPSGVMVSYNANNEPISIEVLNASKRQLY
jgi:hypothetical protein